MKNSSIFHRGLLVAAGLFLLPMAVVLAADFNADGLDDGWQLDRGMWTNAGPNNVAWFQMDGRTQATVVDRSGNGITGTLNGFGPNAFVTGLFSNALQFSANSFVSFAPSNDVLNVASFTVSVWFNATNVSRKTSIVWWNDVYSNSWELSVATNGVGQIQFTDAQANVQTVIGTTPVYDNAWHHLAGAYEVGASNTATATLYLDGVAEGTATISNWTPSAHALFELGSSATSTNGPFTLDEVRLYSMALSSGDILQLPATYSDLLGDGKTSLERYHEFLDSVDPETEKSSSDDASKSKVDDEKDGAKGVGVVPPVAKLSPKAAVLDKAATGNLSVFTHLE